MSVAPRLQFGLRRLLVCVAILAVLACVVGSIAKYELSIRFLINKVASLNGAVNENYPPDEVYFYTGGGFPLVTDRDLQELAPYLEKFGVRRITLSNSRVTGSGLRQLIGQCCDSVQSLSIAGSDINGDSLDVLSACPNLHHLSLSASQVTNVCVDTLAKVGSLRTIVIYGAHPDDEHLGRLKGVVDPSVSIELRSTQN